MESTRSSLFAALTTSVVLRPQALRERNAHKVFSTKSRVPLNGFSCLVGETFPIVQTQYTDALNKRQRCSSKIEPGNNLPHAASAVCYCSAERPGHRDEVIFLAERLNDGTAAPKIKLKQHYVRTNGSRRYAESALRISSRSFPLALSAQTDEAADSTSMETTLLHNLASLEGT